MRFYEAPDHHTGEPHIVRALTASPTLESARVVIDTLNAENKTLLAENIALRAANADLNAELTSLRRGRE